LVLIIHTDKFFFHYTTIKYASVKLIAEQIIIKKSKSVRSVDVRAKLLGVKISLCDKFYIDAVTVEHGAKPLFQSNFHSTSIAQFRANLNFQMRHSHQNVTPRRFYFYPDALALASGKNFVSGSLYIFTIGKMCPPLKFRVK